MKIQINGQKHFFPESCQPKVCHSWFSIKDPDFIEEGSQKKEYCSDEISIPKEIAKIFNPNKLKIISYLSIDINKKKKFESHVVRS